MPPPPAEGIIGDTELVPVVTDLVPRTSPPSATMLLILAALTSLPHHHPQHNAPRDLIGRIAHSNPATLDAAAPARRPFSAGLSVVPTDFGADPTGRKDSWAALTAAMGACLNQSKLSPNGNFPGDTSFGNGKAIRDAGGCSVDLSGGEYRISQPLVLPEYVANMQFGHGSLVASPDFKGDVHGAFLFVIGTKDSCNVPQGSCNIDVNFPELFLDGAHVASGMQINNVMGVTIGPGGYFLNFTSYGLQINGGHEVMMDRCWLGETNFDFDHEKLGRAPNATAIQINGNDHYILNSIVFSSKIGVEVNGAADYVTGVHVWFPDNHAVAFADTMAFHVTGGGNRFSGCYIDGGRAVFEERALSRNIWTNGFECCQGAAPAAGTAASGILLIGDTVGPGLQIMNNAFGGGSIYHRSSSSSSSSGGGIVAITTAMANAAAAAAKTAVVEATDDVAPPVAALTACPARHLNVSAAERECQGLGQVAASSLVACASVCCADQSCSVYQWCDRGGGCDGATGTDAQCWVGAVSGCTGGRREGWSGMSAPSSPPPPIKISGVRIAHNSMQGGSVGTQATLSLTQRDATSWAFDFCDRLVFAQIATVRVHVVAASGFPRAVARPPDGCKVTVETSEAMSGTITVDVDSSEPDDEFS